MEETGPEARSGKPCEWAAPFHVVGVGASAGGLEALEKFFDNMRPDSGLAFVVIQHLSPDFKSLINELLRRHTNIAIHRVEDGMQVAPNSIYLIPPKKEMIIVDLRLPGLNGYDVARRVRGDERCRDVRLIALTGYGRAQDRQAVLKAGFDEHLVKPINPDDLARALLHNVN